VKKQAFDPVLLSYPAVALASDYAQRKVSDVLQERALSHLKTMPTMRREDTVLNQVKEKYDVEPGYLYSPRLAGQNAFYVDRPAVDRFLQTNPDMDPKLRKQVLQSAKRHGLIVAGKGWKKPGVVEHEVGHAVATHAGGPIERFVHRPGVSEYEKYYHTVPSAVLAAVAGRKYGPLTGGAIGALTGLTTGLPMLYRELAADRRAREFMRDKDKEMVSNWPFVGSYLAGATVPFAASGAGIGLVSKLVDKLRHIRK
jgi:hypothetical protein